MEFEPVDAFIERFHTTLTRIRLADLVAVELSATGQEGVISLDKIESEDPGKGHAKCALRALVSIADDLEYEIRLTPDPLNPGTDRERLTNWFKRFNFAATSDGTAMQRKVMWGRNG